MSGRSIGMMFGFGSGLRVAGQHGGDASLTFVPAHINAAGKKVSHRCEIPVYCNSHRGAEGGKRSMFKLVVWGELARKCALTLSPGKAIDVLVEMSSYDGKVYVNRQAVLGAEGTPLTVNKTSLTIMRICFGEEAAKHIAGEIASNLRPQGWDNPASPDFQLWKNELQRRIALQYTGGERFGYARVITPTGQILPPEQAASQYAQPTAAPAPVAAVTAAFGGQAPVAPQVPTNVPAFGAPGTQVAPQAATAVATNGFGM